MATVFNQKSALLELLHGHFGCEGCLFARPYTSSFPDIFETSSQDGDRDPSLSIPSPNLRIVFSPMHLYNGVGRGAGSVKG